jgi:hypothetical protein
MSTSGWPRWQRASNAARGRPWWLPTGPGLVPAGFSPSALGRPGCDDDAQTTEREVTLGAVTGELSSISAASEEAIELCLDAGRPELARHLLAGLAGTMVAEGRHASLARLVARSSRRTGPSAPSTARPARSLPPAPLPAVGGRARIDDRCHGARARRAAARAARLDVPAARSIRRRGRRSLGERVGRATEPPPAGPPAPARASARISCEALAVAFWPDASPRASRNRHPRHAAQRSDAACARSPTSRSSFSPAAIASTRPCGSKSTWSGSRTSPRTRATPKLPRRQPIDRCSTAAAVALAAATSWRKRRTRSGRCCHASSTASLLLQVLDRLAHLTFEADRYQDCVDVCQRLLAADYCRRTSTGCSCERTSA